MPSEIIDEIRAWHRRRCFAMEQRKRNELALGAFVRNALGWAPDLPEKERREVLARVKAVMIDPAVSEFADIIEASRLARAPFDLVERGAIKNMERLVKMLPIWTGFAERVRGLGALSVAILVAEIGDFSDYATVAKIWKRAGLAVFEGKRQGAPGKNAGADEWIRHGYSPMRRSRVWVIGDVLIKTNRDGVYRTVYLQRKAYELARTPEMKPMHAHLRAQRYMEKRLLKHLWQAWRRTRVALPRSAAMPGMSDANSHAEAS